MLRHLRLSSRVSVTLIVLGVSAVGCREVAKDPARPPSEPKPEITVPGAQTPPSSDLPFELKVLAFTRDVESSHVSTAAAASWFRGLKESARIDATVTDDSATFTDEGLAGYDVVAFVNTGGDVLDDEQQHALGRFVESGRGFVGVHSAANTERDWPWYGQIVGAYSTGDSEEIETALLYARRDVDLSSEQTVAHLSMGFSFTDAWSAFDPDPRERGSVVLEVDAAGSGLDAGAGKRLPVSWTDGYEGVRSFYTSLGHRTETWSDEGFQKHLIEGIRWAAGGGSFTRTTLSDNLQNPLAIALRPDGSIYSIERTGQVRLWDATTGHERIALTLEVDTGYENGLLGLAVDPEFESNAYVYLYASEPRQESTSDAGPPGRNQLLRFAAEADGSLDPESRTVLYTVPSERRCCHEGGQLEFMADGSLLLSTGDNTNPFESQGTAPLDDRPGREVYNARRTAQNPMDPRGKILRFTRDGTPAEGNLFADAAEGLPEIYVMGVRNPFRMAADPVEPRVFFGDVGPDAELDAPRGPRGLDEINLVTAPGNYGWPLCIGQNQPYADVDFETNTLGPNFDCEGKVPALFAYDYATPSIAALGIGYLPDGTLSGRTAIAGAVLPSKGAAGLPPRFQGQLLMADWARDVIAAVATSDGGELLAVDRLFGEETFHRPIDIEVDPDGVIYVLEYGSGFWGDNADARLSRIDYGSRAWLSPTARITASRAFGSAPLGVRFSGLESAAAGSQELVGFYWDRNEDGEIDANGPEVTWTFETPGSHVVSLWVESSTGHRSPPASFEVIVGNAPPSVNIVQPVRGSRLALDTPVTLVGTATDPEDGPIACDDLFWNIGLIHNTHSHPYATLRGCETSFVPSAEDHDATKDVLSFSIELLYTDKGGPDGEAQLTTRQGLQFETLGH